MNNHLQLYKRTLVQGRTAPRPSRWLSSSHRSLLGHVTRLDSAPTRGADANNDQAVTISELVKFQQDWFADLRRGTGAAVISSSSDNEYSLEGEQWKNGVFTYALLNGLKNRGADANKDQTITVSELQSYVIDQVRKLTEGGQNPTVRRENLEYDFAVY